MSWQDSDAVRKLFVGNSAAKSVLRCLADFRNEKTGQCNPSTDVIAKETELNRKTVYKAITYLEEKGFIRRERVVLNSSNNYVLNLTASADSPKNGSTKNGSTKYGTSPKNGLSVVPNMGRVVVPNMGHEPLNESGNEPVNNSIESCLVQNRTTFSTEPSSAVNHVQQCTTTQFSTEPTPSSVVNHEPINNINNNINNVVDATAPNFELTADEQEPKKSAVKKIRPITHSFDLKEIPVEWKSLCEKLRPDLEPYKAFVEFQFYWQDGAGANTKRSDSGWRTTWLNYLKSPRTRPTPRPTARPQTFNRAHCLAEPAGGYTTEFYESQMSWEEMNEKRRNGEL